MEVDEVIATALAREALAKEGPPRRVGRDLREGRGVQEGVRVMSEVDEYERVDTTSKQFEASAKFLLGLIEVGYIPDNNEIARRLNVPLGYVERCLEHQTVSQFARQHARMRKQHLDSQK